MIHKISEGIVSEKCVYCGADATHKFCETVWSASFSKVSLVGDEFEIFLCCIHFVEIVTRTKNEKIINTAKDLCFGE